MTTSKGLGSAFKLREIVNVKDPYYGAKGDNSNDDTSALNAAFAEANRFVFVPKGIYKITSNLAKPECAGIIGEGWEPGTAGAGGSWFACYPGVTTGLDLYDTACQVVRDLGISGGSTASAWGIRIGERTSAPYTWDYGKVDNVRVSGFSGANSGGLYMRNANFCSFHDVALDNNTVNLKCDLASVAAGTVPADCWFYNLECSSSTNEAIVVNSGAPLTFVNPRLTGSGKEALLIDPVNGTAGNSSCQVRMWGAACENNYDATHYLFRCVDATAGGGSYLEVRMLDFEVNDVRMLNASGANMKVFLDDPVPMNGTPTVPDTSWIKIENSAVCKIANWGVRSKPNVIASVLTNASILTSAKLVGDSVLNTYTPTPTSLTVVGTPTYSMTYTVIGGRVIGELHVTSTTSTACTGGTTYFDLPIAPSAPGTCTVSDGTATSKGNGVVLTIGRMYPPTWAANADIYISFNYPIATI